MILRRNKSGSWKLRVRVDQGSLMVAQLVEIGLSTRSLKQALTGAIAVMRLYTKLGVIRDKHIKISDPVYGRVINYGDVKAAIAAEAQTPENPNPRLIQKKRKRKKKPRWKEDPRQMLFDF